VYKLATNYDFSQFITFSNPDLGQSYLYLRAIADQSFEGNGAGLKGIA
jgi:hypothetical protein